MYWNTLSLPRSYFINVINRNMRCIEILLKQIAIGSPLRINRNMRCIEIWPNIPSVHAWNWLIETWDVLKLKFVVHGQPARNRLIETWDVLKFFCGSPCASRYSINRNMRCIEMSVTLYALYSYIRLIETWDVLKCPLTLISS